MFKNSLKAVSPTTASSGWPLEEINDFKLVVFESVTENWAGEGGGASASWFWRKGCDDVHVVTSGNSDVLLVTRLLVEKALKMNWALDDPNASVTVYRVRRGGSGGTGGITTYCLSMSQDDVLLETIPFRVNLSVSEEEISEKRKFCVVGQLTARKCMSTLPDIFKLSYPMFWAESFMDPELQNGGLIILAGSTGSGKTTAAYGMIGGRLDNMGGICLSIEDPPELELKGPEVGKGLFIQNSPKRLRQDQDGKLYTVSAEEGWAHSTRELMRQLPATSKGKILFFGELKLPVVAAEAVAQADSGHLVIVTAHGGSVIDTIRRFAGKMSDHSGRPVTSSLASLAGVLRGVYHLNLKAEVSGQKSEGGVPLSRMSVEGSMLLFDRTSEERSSSPGSEILRNCDEKGVSELGKLSGEHEKMRTTLEKFKLRYDQAPVSARQPLFDEFRRSVLGRTK